LGSGAYIMNTFESRNHGLNVSSAFNTLVHSSIGHLDNNLIYSNRNQRASISQSKPERDSVSEEKGEFKPLAPVCCGLWG